MNEKKIISWDVCDIVENEAKYRAENPEEFSEGLEEPISFEEWEKQLFEDQHFFDVEFDDFKEGLSEIFGVLNKHNPTKWFVIEGRNIGWRRRSGSMVKKLITGEEFLALLPDTDCTIHCWWRTKDSFALDSLNFWEDYNPEDEVWAMIYHHDAPTGEFWKIVPFEQISKTISRQEKIKLLAEYYREDLKSYLPDNSLDVVNEKFNDYIANEEVDVLELLESLK